MVVSNCEIIEDLSGTGALLIDLLIVRKSAPPK